jgi:hypothetical protein
LRLSCPLAARRGGRFPSAQSARGSWRKRALLPGWVRVHAGSEHGRWARAAQPLPTA